MVLVCFNRDEICLQTMLLLFKCANHRNKRFFVWTTNEALVGTLMTVGDVNDISAILFGKSVFKKCIICPSGRVRTMQTAQKASQMSFIWLNKRNDEWQAMTS